MSCVEPLESALLGMRTVVMSHLPFNNTRKRAGFEWLRPHDCRPLCASNMLMSGQVEMSSMSRLLNRSTRNSYTRCRGNTDIACLRVVPVYQWCVACFNTDGLAAIA